MADSVFPATGMPDPDWWQALWPDPRKVLDALGARPGMIAVDLCCGDGLFTAALAQVASRVYAIDIDTQMLDRAKVLLAQTGASNCDFIQADAMDVATVVATEVDYVLLANTFHGVPNKQGLSRAVASILKPGGEFVIVNWHRRPREETIVLGQPRGPKTEMRLAPLDVAATVELSGLRLGRIVELPPYHYGVIFVKLAVPRLPSPAPVPSGICCVMSGAT